MIAWLHLIGWQMGRRGGAHHRLRCASCAAEERIVSSGRSAGWLALLVLGATVGCGAPARTAPGPIPASPPAAGPGRPVAVPPVPRLDVLEQQIRVRIAEEDEAEVGVALVDLGTGQRLEVNAHLRMHAASTMKVPVLLELFRQAEVGRLSLDEVVVIDTVFGSIAGDTTYALSRSGDSEKSLYDRAGEGVPARELARLMTVRSSNLALNLLIARVGVDNVMRTMGEIGASDMHVLRGVEDTPAYRQGLNNTTTAAAFAKVLESIARCAVTRRSACDAMVEILAAQEFNNMIPAALPAGTRVAHKTGSITGIRHDGGIVYPDTRAPYVLVVLTRGFGDTQRANRTAADISRMVWDQLTDPSFTTHVRPAGRGAAEVRAAALLALHRRYRVGAIGQRHFGHAQLWRALEPLLGTTVIREEAGRSAEGRALHVLRFGTGPTRVMLWSQMHGDESTATQALLDLVHFMHAAPADPRLLRWSERLTVLMVPMLNPDGAERFQRQNAVGIDVNRDARSLSTPEGRTLKALRERYQPQFGFNLHDQNPRTRVGSTDRLVAISLLAPPPDAERTPTDGFVRAQHVASTVRLAIEPLVGGHISEYDPSFNPRAFGDLMQQWGTSTVLIESGGWSGDPEKQYLRAVNFVALTTVLDAIADGSYAEAGLEPYQSLPRNGRSVVDLLIRGGSIVLPGSPPVRADITADFSDGAGSPLRARIREVGDITSAEARDTIDATGLFLHPFATDGSGDPTVAPGRDASFSVRRGIDPASEEVFRLERGLTTAGSG